MNHEEKTKDELIEELQRQLAEMEQAEIRFRRAEQARQESEERYRFIFDSVPVSIWEEDFSQLKAAIDRLKAEGIDDFREFLDEHPDFLHRAAQMIHTTDVNAQTLRLYNAKSKDELLGAPAKVLVPGSPEAFREEIIAIADQRHVFETEGVTKTLDDQHVNVLVRMAIPNDTSDFEHLLITLMDITERKRAEEALRKSEERFRVVFETAQDCIYLKDTDLRFTQVNPAMERLLGRRASDLIGLKAQDLYGEDAGKHITEVDLRVLAGEAVEEEHTRFINGAPYTFHDIRVPLRSASGEVVGLCGISRNITDRKRLDRAFVVGTRSYPSRSMQAAMEKARHVAATDSVVLLLGESGSGKDFMARYIHANSGRSQGQFFEINCAALSRELVESELFGHEPGAYTGARGRKRGLLELAEGGTLLLNEIGELSLAMQSKLLTFLDSRSFTRVGGEKTIRVNARLVAATHRDLREEIAAGRFLQALFYRLDVFSIRVPPLRERREDIPILVQEILAKLVEDMHLPEVPELEPVQLRALAQHSWPGNVRELRNVLERALILWHHGCLDIPVPWDESSADEWCSQLKLPVDLNLQRFRDRLTRSLCLEALKRAGGNKKLAACFLGVSRFSFYRYLKSFGLEGESVTQT